MLPTNFQVSWTFGSEEEVKNRFSRWRLWWPSRISYQNDFRYIWSISHPNAPFQVLISLSVQEKKRKIDSQDGRHGGYLGFPIRTISAFFFIYKSPWCFLPNFKSFGILFQEKKEKIDFQDGSHGGHKECDNTLHIPSFTLFTKLLLMRVLLSLDFDRSIAANRAVGQK